MKIKAIRCLIVMRNFGNEHETAIVRTFTAMTAIMVIDIALLFIGTVLS